MLAVFLKLPRKFCDLATYLFNEDGTLADTFVRDVAVLPVGVVLWRASTVAPAGWLTCDGREVSRAEYPELFAVIGTRFGAGNGTTTFNLPQTKGSFLAGYDAADPNFNQIGASGGESEHALTASENGPHDHQSFATTEGPCRGFPLSEDDRLTISCPGGFAGWPTFGPYRTSSEGNGDAHNNLPKFVTGTFIIKT